MVKHMKKIALGLILLFLALITFYYFNQNKKEPVIISANPTSIPTLAPTTQSPTITPIPTRPDKELITEALAIKYNLAYAEVKTIISEINSTQASGTVSFSGEGGWFLAIKEGDKWKIVADGNGTVSCELVEPYSFPKSMLPECVDKDGQLKKL